MVATSTGLAAFRQLRFLSCSVFGFGAVICYAESPMSSDNSQAAATKQDIKMIMDQIGKLYDANERWKDEILEQQKEWKEEIVHEFKVVAEDFRHDAMGANKDRIENHEDRIVRLEQHTKLLAA